MRRVWLRSVRRWREAFDDNRLWFGFVQLSTWCALPPESLPLMREAQLAALALDQVAMATNADHGMGCSIHPAAKQYCSERLATAALAMIYKRNLTWRSPTYASAIEAVAARGPRGVSSARPLTVQLLVSLDGVGDEGLHTIYPHNYRSPNYGSGRPAISVDCTATFPVNQTANASMADQCAWASLHVRSAGWLNATVSAVGQKLLLTAQLPAGAMVTVAPEIVGSAYAFGPIPMMSAYDKATGLPVLPWNQSLGENM